LPNQEPSGRKEKDDPTMKTCLDICKQCNRKSGINWDSKTWFEVYPNATYVYCPVNRISTETQLSGFPSPDCPFKMELLLTMQDDKDYPKKTISGKYNKRITPFVKIFGTS